MYKIITSTKDLPHEKWLEYRRLGIGGSDASTIVGLNPYSSLFSLYADKKGLISPSEDTEIMRQGRDFEEYVARRFTEATGKKVRRRNYMFKHDVNDFMLADIDREIVGENAGLECKTTSLFNKSDFENGEIPLYYYVQMTHYMAVMGYDRMYLAVLVLSKAFYWFVIERDEDEINELVDAEKCFWNDCIMRNTPPAPDGSQATSDAIEKIYNSKVSRDFTVSVSEELMKEYDAAKKLHDESKERLDELKAKIQLTLGENTYGLSDSHKISWLPQSRTTVNSKLLKKDFPEAYAKCMKTSESRVLRISLKKAEV